MEKGFIRLACRVLPDGVQISVEDSGPGIPESKHENLFARFQESLDILQQGTGMGLSLCHRLVDMMRGKIFLDTSYDSGIEGCPGTRFVIKLHATPVQIEMSEVTKKDDVTETETLTEAPSEGTHPLTLPEELNVLLVDDDQVLRKMMNRSIRRLAPKWKIREAANGETALSLVEDNHFDLIFMDHYMSSVVKQMLGTETVAALRSRNVDSRICGLSANDMREAFLSAGADHFMMKPFSTDVDGLRVDMCRALGLTE